MKALVLEDYMKLVYKDVPDPVPAPDEVLIRVKAAGICGSDVHGMDGSTGRRIPPLIMGHEAAGVILQKGNKVSGWSAGDRVTFDSTIYNPDDWYSRKGMYNLSDGRKILGVSTPEFRRDGAYAEMVAVPAHILFRIPENVGFTQAAMVEPAAVAMHAISLTPLEKDSCVLVIGAGTLGLCLVQLLKIAGYTRIFVAEIDPVRCEIVRELDVDYVFQPAEGELGKKIFEMTGGRGVDAVIEAVGLPDAVKFGLDHLRRGGTMTVLGNLTQSMEIPLQKIVTGQIRLQGSYAIAGEYPEILELLRLGKLKTDILLSAEVPLSEGSTWFHSLYRKEGGLIKVILKP
jgi:L-iditol 2-dehydrogenase